MDHEQTATRQKFVPADSVVLVTEVEQEQKTPAGVVLPSGAQRDRARLAIVVAAHEDVMDGRLTAGDRVLITPTGGYRTTLNGLEHLVVEDRYLLGAVEEADE